VGGVLAGFTVGNRPALLSERKERSGNLEMSGA
jgi:hypothetical protein